MWVAIRSIKPLTFFAIGILLLTIAACGPGYSTSTINGVKKVYYTNEQGDRALVYEVDRDGNTTVHDENDPMYQQHLARQQMAERARQAAVERHERIKLAAKRKNHDPIYVALHPTTLDEQLKQVERRHGAVFDQVRDEFTSDQVIKLVSKRQLERKELSQLGMALGGMYPSRRPVADVEVVSRAYLKEVLGIHRETGKPGKMVAVVFEATITSNFLPAEYTVTEIGNVLRNVEVAKQFAERIKRVIKDKIGPTIPADRSAY